MDIRESYLQAWNETDADARRTRLAETWAADGTYVDPLGEAAGLDAVSELIGAVQAQFAGLEFTPVGEVDSHHRVARFQWGLGPAGEEPLAVGFDVVTLDDGGRIRSVVGFIDKMPG